jgi:Na+-driven multidrug efflux pump
MQISALAYQVAIGLEQASCTVIGQEIGRNDVAKAKELFKTL